MLVAAQAAVTGAAGAVLWTPEQLDTDLLWWHDAQRQDGYAEGNAVTQWDALAGVGDLISAGATDPVWRATALNGRPGIEIDTDDQHMEVDSILGAPISQPFTVAIVGQLDDTAAGHVLWSGSSDAGGSPSITFATGGGGLRAVAGDTAITTGSSGGGVPFMLVAVYAGEGSCVYLNGTRSPTPPTLVDAGDDGTDTAGWYLGAATGTWGGIVGEIVAIQGNHDGTEELDQLTAYMTTRWGL